MQDLFNYILRIKVKIALHFYFSKILVTGKEHIPKGKAVLVVSNHQNALIDPILIATHTKLNPYFLTRASVFKKSFVAKMLDFIRMIPIYRVRDGINNMEKNKDTFDKSTQVLLNKGSMVIFGEGSHSIHRNLRPLRKGFARIAYQALEKDSDLDLVILPVGINYSNHQKSGSKVHIFFGPTIDPKNHYPNFESLIKTTQQSLKPLVSHIPEENYQEKLERLIQNRIDLTAPKSVATFLNNTENQKTQKTISPPYFTNKVMKVFLFPVYWIWLIFVPKIKDPAFTATFKFVIGLVTVPLWYIFLLIGSQIPGLASWSISFAFLGFVFLLANRSGQA
ncbi:lysophospholipid acyltransferase family protein [Aquiflexum sp.]|uniref:lysophospholipid acyltransferase family protein n=1 Tax=Aquiflexum sp. TaxID=1872584 RepID=UPI0035930931